MNIDEDRINFRARTRRIIAMRSGYRCAHPECEGRTTVGPATSADEYEDTGRAAHIFAASKRGPRGHGNLSESELRSVANGIWLCAKHADQVDVNNGKDYPPPVLLGWKAAHEFRIAREHGAVRYPFGWVERLEIIESPLFKPNQYVSFANMNVIMGDTGVGKSAICEWLWALKDSSKLWRWGAYPENGRQEYGDIAVAIDFRAPARERLTMRIVRGRTEFQLDGPSLPISPVGYEIVTLHRRDARSAQYTGDADYLARLLAMDATEVRALTEYINENPGLSLKQCEWRLTDMEDGEDPVPTFHCRFRNDPEMITLQGRSGGEEDAVSIDLAIARARILSTRRPTLLIIEMDETSLDSRFMSEYLTVLASPDIPFQSILVTSRLHGVFEWGGWQVIRLHQSRVEPGRQALTEVIVGDVYSAPQAAVGGSAV